MPDEPRRERTLPSWLLPTPARRDERAGPPLREFTLRLMRGEDLRREEAAALLDALLDGTATDAQIGAALVALAGRGLYRVRATLRTRWMELACYLAVALGMLLLVNLNGYVYRKGTDVFFEQTRYLFPLLALYAALVAIAARGAGRYGPALGAAIVVLAFGHTVFSQALTVGRYYDYVGTPGFVRSGEAQRQNRLRPVTPGEPKDARPSSRAGP